MQRFETLQPNKTWQSDFTYWRLKDGSDVEIINASMIIRDYF